MTLFLAQGQAKHFISFKKAEYDRVSSYNYDWQAEVECYYETERREIPIILIDKHGH